MDIYEINGKAWNTESQKGNYWTQMIGEERILAAREGRPELWITPFKSVPLSWLEGLRGKDVLIACGGGGQQTPTLAAFGCNVTTIDISELQIEQDRLALEKYNLKANVFVANVLDMPFGDSSFDAVIIPQALNFIDDLRRAYDQTHRVLRLGGSFLFGIANPATYMFDDRIQDKRLKIRYTLPFSDLRSLSHKELQRRLAKGDTIEFSHTLQSIIGGLVDAGFHISGYYSDECGSQLTDSFLQDSHMAFRAIRN